MKKISIGIDTGGTFTDICVLKDGLEIIDHFKILSTPEEPSKAVFNSLDVYESISKKGKAKHQLIRKFKF